MDHIDDFLWKEWQKKQQATLIWISKLPQVFSLAWKFPRCVWAVTGPTQIRRRLQMRKTSTWMCWKHRLHGRNRNLQIIRQCYVEWHAHYGNQAAIAQLGERQTEDLKVPRVSACSVLARPDWTSTKTSLCFATQMKTLSCFWKLSLDFLLKTMYCLYSGFAISKAFWLDSATFPFANPMLKTPIVNVEQFYRPFNFLYEKHK